VSVIYWNTQVNSFNTNIVGGSMSGVSRESN